VHYHVKDTAIQTQVIAIDTLMTEADSTALAIIAPYKASMEAEMEEVIAYADEALSKAQPEGMLNNFVADLVLEMARKYYTDGPVDFCLMNNGGLRSSLPRGEIRVRNVYELMPFENRISIMKLKGAKVVDLCDYVAEEGGMPVSGLRMGIKNEKALNVLVQSLPLDTSKMYTVATVDYLADGGDKMSFFKDPVQRIDLNVLIRNIIIEYLRKLTADGLSVKSKLDGRIYYEK
jgi:2',3'-cyclic-nucleotide 2'-phosphodiesterase (5'-nucleotidase family)